MEAKEVRRTGSAGEAIYGFAQAVRSGDTIYISGQTASTDDDTTELGDVRDQMIAAYAKIAELLGSYGGDMRNVVDETLFVTDMRASNPGCGRGPAKRLWAATSTWRARSSVSRRSAIPT